MPQTVTLELPDTIYTSAKRTAEVTRRLVEEVLVNVITSSLPSLKGLPQPLAEDLTNMETLSDDELRQAMLTQLPSVQQRKLARLLRKNQAGTLSEREKEELARCNSKRIASCCAKPARPCCCAGEGIACRHWKNCESSPNGEQPPNRRRQTAMGQRWLVAAGEVSLRWK